MNAISEITNWFENTIGVPNVQLGADRRSNLICEDTTPSSLKVWVTTYANAKSPKPIRSEEKSWSRVVEMLSKRELRDNKDGLCLCLHSILDGASRANANINRVYAFVIDVDNGTDFADVAPRLASFEYIAYSTHSHSLDNPKYRIVLPLLESVSGEDWGTVWAAINRALCADINDKSTKDASRLFYAPSCPPQSERDSWEIHYRGKLLDPRDYLSKSTNLPTVKPAAQSARANIDINLDVLGNFPPAPSIGQVMEACASVGAAKESGCSGGYDEWLSMLGVAKHCDDPEAAAVTLSENHKEYSYEQTVKKLHSLTGAPTKCTTINSAKCGACKWKAAGASTPIHAAQMMVARSIKPAMATQVKTAIADNAIIESTVAEINDSYFIARENGETSIFCEYTSHDTDALEIREVSQQGMALKFANRFVPVSTGGGTKMVNAFTFWKSHPDRREYHSMGFHFGDNQPEKAYNLWRGFSVEPTGASPKLILRHLWECSSRSKKVFRYLLCWMAFCVQRPGDRTETVVVLRGGEGAGKGTIARLLTALFGTHALHISNSKHLTGNFNAHLRTALFLFVDEGYFSGDRAAEGVLKQLITENQIAIEKKGVDVFMARNRLKIMMASNNDWVVPAGRDSRRYCVIDVPASMVRNWEYWESLNKWLDGCGLSAFLGFMQRIDLSKFNVREVPITRALESLCPRFLGGCMRGYTLVRSSITYLGVVRLVVR